MKISTLTIIFFILQQYPLEGMNNIINFIQKNKRPLAAGAIVTTILSHPRIVNTAKACWNSIREDLIISGVGESRDEWPIFLPFDTIDTVFRKSCLLLGGNPNVTKQGKPLLIVAIEKHRTDVMQQLLNAGANPDIIYNGKPALYYVINNYTPQKKLSLADSFFNSFVPWDYKDPKSSAEMMKILIDAGANVNARYDENTMGSILSEAAKRNQTDLVKLLLDANATIEQDFINQLNKTDIKTIYDAHNKNKKLKVLEIEDNLESIAKGSSAHGEISNLIAGYLFDSADQKKQLDKKNEIEDNNKISEGVPSEMLLHPPVNRFENINYEFLAALSKKVTTPSDVINFLKRNAQLDAQDLEGYTPLIIAIIYDRPDIIDLLLERIQKEPNAPELLKMQTKSGDTALDWAVRLKRKHTADRLRKLQNLAE